MTLRRLSSVARPPTSWSTTFCLRAWVTEKSMVGSAVFTPKVAASSTARRTAAVSSSSLAGMQPTLRQVPPSLPFSIRAIDRPADAP